MLTLSDLYQQDVEEGTILVPDYPTSCRKHLNNIRLFVNCTKYLIDDESKPPDVTTYKVLMPTRIALVCGTYLRLCLENEVDPLIMKHWVRKLGQEVPIRIAHFGEKCPHLTQFPLDDLPDELHAVDPNFHYRIHSKFFIPTIRCPQPRVLPAPEIPCVLKTARAAGSEGTWLIRSEQQYEDTMTWLQENMPKSQVLLTELIQPVDANFCVQFYVSKTGKITWLGVTEQVMDDEDLWCGSLYQAQQQKWLEFSMKSIMEPIAHALAPNYFGIVGVDVLVKGCECFVIDINPRINGSTPFLLSTKHKRLRGWGYGLFYSGVKVPISLERFLAVAEFQKDCDVFVFGAAEEKDSLNCQVAIYANSKSKCQSVLCSLQKIRPDVIV